MPRIAKSCQTCKNLSGVSLSCQKLPRITNSCRKLVQIAKGCQTLPMLDKCQTKPSKHLILISKKIQFLYVRHCPTQLLGICAKNQNPNMVWKSQMGPKMAELAHKEEIPKIDNFLVTKPKKKSIFIFKKNKKGQFLFVCHCPIWLFGICAKNYHLGTHPASDLIPDPPNLRPSVFNQMPDGMQWP